MSTGLDSVNDGLGAERQRLAALACRWAGLLADVSTPFLIVDEVVARANAATAAEHARTAGLTIRPHAKAHKCSALLRLQLDAGNAHGLTCATVHEAVALARLGFDDLLVANEVVSTAATRTLASAAMSARVSVAVDSELGVQRAAEAAVLADCEIGVLIDLDVGSGRCGVLPESGDAAALATSAAERAGLHLEGIMAYTGRGNYYADPSERHEVAVQVRKHVESVRGQLERAGVGITKVSGGSTGLWDLDQGLTELQLGTYVVMEARYAEVGLPFLPALFCAATVVSATRPGHVVLDCGWKAVSAELGLPLGPPELTPLRMSDEHLICAATDGAHAVGDVVLLLPAHLDPTVNLHDRLLVVGADGRVDEWPIDLRRAGPLLGSTATTRSDAEVGPAIAESGQ